ncbi:origin recognition complex subunit 4 C-terminus-domain-containing protein [Coemansia spiralis]|nr:origin recognition complex subunit 4 C-terminus-domain-containing protein [Coemansia spiralis]
MPARKSLSLQKETAVDINKARQLVLGRLCGRVALPELIGLASPLDAVFSLLYRTVSNDEGNSALLIGPRGSGKSSVISKALSLVAEKRKRENITSKYHIVRLSGFIHTNDKIALRDIARQLLIEQDLENILIGSFADAFTYILNLLRVAGVEGEYGQPPVLFILEEFDLLAQHPKQSLLYTLFDIAQSQQTPIAVLGVTARIDVMDLLEKRVKSRFSHRQIHVHYMQSLDDFTSIARAALHLPLSDNINNDNNATFSEIYVSRFNSRVDEILATESVAAYIATVFDLGKDVRQLLRAFVLAASHITIEQPLLQLTNAEASIAKEEASAKFQVISSISLLELCLIISMKSLVQGGSSKYNFEMVYNEYKTFMSRHLMAAATGGTMKVYKKPIALKAFEALVELEVVRPVTTAVSAESNASGGAFSRNDMLAGSTQGARAPKEYRMVQIMLEPGQIVELMANRIDVPMVIRRWAQQ